MNSGTPLYRIRDWDEHFETAQSRRVKAVSWIGIPLKQGRGFRRVSFRVTEGDADLLWSRWHLIVQVAATCPIRGVLYRDGSPLTAHDLCELTGPGFDAAGFERALAYFSADSEKGWVEKLTGEAARRALGARSEHEHLQTDKHNRQTNTHSASMQAAALGGGRPNAEEPRSEVYTALVEAGITGPKLSDLAGQPGITVKMVRDARAAAVASPNVKSVPALTVLKLGDMLSAAAGKVERSRRSADAMSEFGTLERDVQLNLLARFFPDDRDGTYTKQQVQRALQSEQFQGWVRSAIRETRAGAA